MPERAVLPNMSETASAPASTAMPRDTVSALAVFWAAHFGAILADDIETARSRMGVLVSEMPAVRELALSLVAELKAGREPTSVVEYRAAMVARKRARAKETSR